MKTSWASKRAFYSPPAVARSYDALRFGGPSGAWLDRRERTLVRSLLPPAGRVLDLACGTGRLAADLAERGYRVVAADAALGMLRVTSVRASVPVAQGDAFALPFGDGAFDAVVALRLLFHHPEVRPLLREMRRVTRSGGTVVFDTHRWTPRALVSVAADRWGGKIFVHPAHRVLRYTSDLGLEPAAAQYCFLFSPYAYRLLPLPVVDALARLETTVPPWLRARVFWRFVRPSAA